MFVKHEDCRTARKLTALALRHAQFVEAFIKGIEKNTEMSDEDKATRIKELQAEADYAKRAAVEGQTLAMKMEINYKVAQKKKGAKKK